MFISITNCGTFKGFEVLLSESYCQDSSCSDSRRKWDQETAARGCPEPQAGKCWHPWGISQLRGDLLGHSLLGKCSSMGVWVLTLSGHGASKHKRGLVSEGHIVRVALGVPGQMPR